MQWIVCCGQTKETLTQFGGNQTKNVELDKFKVFDILMDVIPASSKFLLSLFHILVKVAES